MKINKLSSTVLKSIANSLRTYGQVVGSDLEISDDTKNEINELLALDSKALVSHLLESLAEQKRYLFDVEHDLIELVWSGPEVPGLYNRDTMVVVDDLFRSVKQEIYISGYNFYEGKKIFRALFENIQTNPNLRIKMFFNVSKQNNHEDPDLAIDRFRKSFLKYNWESELLPELYYDPRSLEVEVEAKAVLHAKTIIVDKKIAFITSANFTGKAQKENIEVGALIKNDLFSTTLRKHFDSLIEAKIVERLKFS